MALVGRIGIKRNPQPHRGDHAISIRIDTSTKALAKSQILEVDPEVAKVGGKWQAAHSGDLRQESFYRISVTSSHLHSASDHSEQAHGAARCAPSHASPLCGAS